MKMIKRSFSLLMILAMLLGMTMVAQASGKTYYTTGQTAVYAGPGKEFSVITKLAKNAKVTATGKHIRDNNSIQWDCIKVNGHTGWVMDPSISKKKNGDTSKGTLVLTRTAPLRKGPSTSTSRLTNIKKGKTLKYYDSVTDSNGRLWLLVRVKGKIGWVSSKYADITSK